MASETSLVSSGNKKTKEFSVSVFFANSPSLLQVIFNLHRLSQYLFASSTDARLSGLSPERANEINKVGLDRIK
jgi:hypothetical protein